jgi:O-antigen/teichoic acid export membrane protein
MGVTEYGVFIYAYSWIVFLSLTAKWGLDKVIVRFGAPILAAHRRDAYEGLLHFGLWSALACAAVVTTVTLIVVALLRSRMAGNLEDCLMLATVWLPLIALQRVHEGAAESFRNMFQATVPDYLLRPGLLGGLVLAHRFLMGSGPDAVQVVNYYSLVLGITVVAHRIWLRHVWGTGERTAPAPSERRRWIAFGTHMTLINSVSYAASQADVLIIGLLLSTTEAGIYSVAARIATFTGFVSTAALMVFAPAVAELHARGAIAELRQKSFHLAKRIVLFSLLVSVGLGVIGPFVLRAFGASFAAAALPLVVLLAGYCARSFFAVSEALLNMSGNELATLRIMVVCAGLNLALNVALLHLTGQAIGAALATALSGIVMYALLHREAQGRLFRELPPR